MTSALIFFVATILPMIVIVAVLVVRRIERPAPWILAVASLLALTVTNVDVVVQAAAGVSPAVPGALLSTIGITVGHIGLLLAAVLVVLPVARGDGGAVIDFAIASICVAGLLWTALLAPALDAAGTSSVDRVLLLLRVLLVCGTAGAIVRARLTALSAHAPLVYLLVASVAMVWATVLGGMLQAPTADEALLQPARNMLWVVAHLALGASALHPTARDLHAPGRAPGQPLSVRHLVTLGIALASNFVLTGVLELTGVRADNHLLIIGALVVVPLFLVRVWQVTRLFEESQAELVRQATHDQLTGLPNRRAITDHLEETIRQVEAGRLAGARVCFLDLDDFKSVNDTHGHLVGDLLLVAVSERLRRAVRRDDFVARFGGDEFVIVLPCDGDDLASQTVDRIDAALAPPVEVGGATIVARTSIGSVAIVRGEGQSVDQVLSRADAHMYEDKRDRASR